MVPTLNGLDPHGMPNLAALVTPFLVLLIPVALAAAIARLAGDRRGVTLAEFMSPLAAPAADWQEPRRPAMPEPEPVAWRWDGIGQAAPTVRGAPSRTSDGLRLDRPEVTPV